MKKMISLFKRDYDGDRSLVLNEVSPGAEWVIEGEGIATRKWDGTCCMIKDGVLFKRYDAKIDDGVPIKPVPQGFIPAQTPDELTGHWPGWLAVGGGPEDEWHREGFKALKDNLYHTPNTASSDVNAIFDSMRDGTYELIGPKINGGREGYGMHELVRHGDFIVNDCPRDYDGLKEFFADRNKNVIGGDEAYPYRRLEGIVWHHPDGRMVKIKSKDFGIAWGR